MKILHYSLGFPPYRSGGLTKFCMDLMREQKQNGNEVALLWPGEIRIGNKTKIKYRGIIEEIHSYEVINPTPVSYDEGIQKFDLFQQKGTLVSYEEYLKNYAPDVIHIHTLMGIHENFLVAAKKLKIKLVFSAHDYFPICPKVTLFRENKICDSIATCENCVRCNSTALPIWKINILQSKIYRGLKDSVIVKKLRKNHRDNYKSGMAEIITDSGIGDAKDYYNLRMYNKRLLEYMDIIHYNSSVTKKVYEKYFGKFSSVMIPITHGDINDNRKRKAFDRDKLKITYLGPYGGEKGFFLLKKTLDELWDERKDFCLNVFFEMNEKPVYLVEHGRYVYRQLEDIFDMTDILIVPSIWYETFGYTVLEALSFGVPVIVTKNVGAKNIIPQNAGIIVEDISVEGIKRAIKDLNREKLKEMNEAILASDCIITLSNMNKEIIEKCYYSNKER